MDDLERLNIFEYHNPSKKRQKEYGWQFAPMQMIYDTKYDLCRKARFVVGGHIINSSQHMTYSSTIKDILVRKKKGDVVVPKRALYELKASSASFHMFLGDFLQEMGFTSTRAGQDLWLKRSEHHDGYDYIATHVDDLIIAAKEPQCYMTHIKQYFQRGNKLDISTKSYVKEILRKYQVKHGSIPKENLPIQPTERSELDKTPMLDTKQRKDYQLIIGIYQWLIVPGQLDIMYAVSSLSGFSAAPREGHLTLARKIFGYLKNTQRR
eukprot:9145374-Ditylum_brightwellii.AAC.1